MTNQCPRCATPRLGDYPFCQTCGLDFRAGPPAMPPQQQLPPQQPPEGAPQQPPAYQPLAPQPQAAPAVCPRCNAPLYPGYTRCTNCGYDSSAAWGTPAPAASSRGPVSPIVLGLAVVGVLVAAGALIYVATQHNGSSASSPSLQPGATATASLALAPTGTPTLADTPAATPTPTSQPFVISDPAFVPAVSDSCDGDMQITGASGTGLTVGGTIPMINNQFVVFCYGAKHTWIGTLTYSGYTFASDTTDPLQFKVVQDQGYVYVGGTGTVTSPDGSVVTLPN